ncbi:MAG: hypothetical protein JKX78_10240 [Alteromonadaceae bacterium]|nr:hypothetical protein [Alteromonadaceae bacterium]
MSLKEFLLFTKDKNEKNISLTVDDIDALHSHAAVLIQSYKAKTDNENDEIVKLLLPNPSIFLTDGSIEKLSEIANKITHSRSISQFPVAVFLSTIPHKTPTNRTLECEKWRIIQARLLIVCHHLFYLKGYEDILIRVMTDYRMLVHKQYSFLISTMPDFELDVEQLIKLLSDIKEKIIYEELEVKGKESTSIKQNIPRIRNFIRLFSDYWQNNLTYKKREVDRGKNIQRPPKISPVASKIIAEEHHDVVEEITQPIIDNEKYPYDFDERTAEQETIARYFSVDLIAPNEVSKSLARQNVLSNATINHILRREKYLTSDVNQLTVHEVYLLMNNCLSDPKGSLQSTIILLSLCTGRTVEQLLSPEFVFQKITGSPFNGRFVVLSKPQLPKPQLPNKLLKLITPSIGSVILSLPRLLDGFLEVNELKSCNIDEVKKQISTQITDLNRKHGSKITQARIANYLATFLHQHGSDDIEMCLLLGWDPKHFAGSYYYQINVRKLLLLHQKYLLALYYMAKRGYADTIKFEKNIDASNEKTTEETTNKTHVKLDHKDDKEEKQNNTKQKNVYVGSNLQVNSDIVSQLFSILSKNLSDYKGDKFEFHNQYTLYTLLLLNLSLGHRPVNDPYESAEIFDYYGGTVFICDKESRSDLSARTLVMPDTALAQIKYYSSHLQSMLLYCANILPANTQRIKDALTGSEPFFFFFKNTKIGSVTPTNLAHKLKQIFPLPINWHRHYMRTKLRKLGVAGQLVDLWMGHLGIGSTNMSKFSYLSLHDLRQVANKIEQHLKDDLKIAAVQGL